MAKNFPYFKFVATEWLTGNIVFEDFELQGIFINICALYWHRDGKITLEKIAKRLKNERIYDLKNNFFNVGIDGFININFLDEQLIEANHISKINSEKGKKSALKRAAVKQRLNNGSTGVQPISTNKNKNKNKSKEEKEEEININDIISYFLENGYSDLAAKKFYDYYSVSKWKDSKGNKVKNWKQKAQAVWFKDENKIKDDNSPIKMVY